MINAHTPGNFPVHLLTAGVGDRFERDTNLVGGNHTTREKVVSDGWDGRGCVWRQSPRVRQLSEWSLIGRITDR